MGKIHSAITDDLRRFIAAQKIFFVATAPAGATGHVNLSPKGLDTFAIVDGTTVAYLDYAGSGAETIAHLRENGRIVIMMCAFEGPPKILRLHGRGEAIEARGAGFAGLRPWFPASPPVRAIIRVRLDRISDSCGYGVPLYRFEGHRPHMDEWSARKGEPGLAAYQREKNQRSIDGLPALRWTEREGG